MFVLAVPGDATRDFLLTAWDHGMIQTGEYVFMDVVLFSFPSYWGNPSWHRGDSNDQKAKRAYEALIRFSLLEPSGPDYDDWSELVKERAKDVYGFDYDAHNETVGVYYGNID